MLRLFSFASTVRVHLAAILSACSMVTLLPTTLFAQVDRVRLIAGGTEPGEVESMTSTTVQIRQGTRRTPVPVNEILMIQFGREPIELTKARSEIRNGAYREALKMLADLRPSDLRPAVIRDEFEFQSALASARVALGTNDPDALRNAGRSMNEFVNTRKNNFHYFEAVEVLGDIFAALERYGEAQAQYAILAGSPWPDYKIRARVLEGRALAAQGMHQQAIQRFDDALALETNAPGVAEQQLAAKLGRAGSQAELGQTEEAIKAVQQVIALAEPEAIELQARAHNVLGKCHLKAGSQKEALYAYLYVDILCSSAGDAHAEALFHLIPLFRAVGRDEDSRQTRERLLQRYPQSRWTKRLTE